MFAALVRQTHDVYTNTHIHLCGRDINGNRGLADRTAYTMNVLCTVTNRRNEINDNDKNQSELICARFEPTEKKLK